MKTLIWTMVIGALYLGLTLGNSGTAAGAEGQGGNNAKSAAAVTSESQKDVARAKADPPEVTIRLRDGNSLQAKLLTDPVPVETRYGALKVPASELIAIYQGLHNETIHTDGAAVGSESDMVVTQEFTIAGRLALDGYEFDSSLGKIKIGLEKIESLSRPLLNVPPLTLPASLTSVGASAEYKNWRYSNKEEPGWTRPTFDDTRWKRPSSPAVSNIGATLDEGISCPEIAAGSYGYLRRCFLLSSQPKAASVGMANVTSYDMFINGIQVAWDSKTWDAFDITHALRPGINVIAIKAKVRFGNGRVDFRLNAQ